MASLITCPACKKLISSRAERCPHCGDITPTQQARIKQTQVSTKGMNITINAGEVNNGLQEDRGPHYSKVENPSLKEDFYCSTCKFYRSRLRDFLFKTILTTIIGTIIFFVPNYFGWWSFFSVILKCICLIAWIIFIIRYFNEPEDHCKNEHVIVALGSNDPTSRINANFKCKFWENKE